MSKRIDFVRTLGEGDWFFANEENGSFSIHRISSCFIEGSNFIWREKNSSKEFCCPIDSIRSVTSNRLQEAHEEGLSIPTEVFDYSQCKKKP